MHQQLIGLRRRHPWLHTARSETTTPTNETMVVRLTASGSLTLALCLSDKPLVLDAPGAVLAGAAEDDGGERWRVPAHGWAVTG